MMRLESKHNLRRRLGAQVTSVFVIGALAGCGAVDFAEGPERAFVVAVERNVDESWGGSANAAHSFLTRATEDDERYDRAALVFAEDLEELELHHAAATWYLDVASGRRDATVIDEALTGLERLVNAELHDEDTMVAGYLANSEINGIDPEARELQGFIAYQQGLDSLRRGRMEWAETTFGEIPETSKYRHWARYALALADLARAAQQEEAEARRARRRRRRRAMSSDERRARGRESLEGLLDEYDEAIEADVETDIDRRLVTEALITLARLAMDEERYTDAVELYKEVQSQATERPELMLELAWAHYRIGDSRRALGFLLALDAPMYGDLIAPERYLLEATTLQRLCQFEPARIAATRLRARYGDALRDLHRGVLPFRSEALRAAARGRGAGLAAATYRRRLETEREQVDEMTGRLGPTLSTYLNEFYDIAIAEAYRREDVALRTETRLLARELLRAEAGVDLVLHDLSVGLLRGRQRPPGPEEVDQVVIEADAEEVAYQFDGEFWTDELDSLIVTIEDRCLE